MEENQSETTYENILTLVANRAADNNEIVRQLAHNWIEHNPDITYDQLVQYYQKTADDGNRNSILPPTMLKAIWHEIIRAPFLRYRELLQKIIIESIITSHHGREVNKFFQALKCTENYFTGWRIRDNDPSSLLRPELDGEGKVLDKEDKKVYLYHGNTLFTILIRDDEQQAFGIIQIPKIPFSKFAYDVFKEVDTPQPPKNTSEEEISRKLAFLFTFKIRNTKFLSQMINDAFFHRMRIYRNKNEATKAFFAAQDKEIKGFSRVRYEKPLEFKGNQYNI